MSLPFGTLFAAVQSATGAQLDACFQQAPCLVASARLTGQTAAIPNLLTYAVGLADGTFTLFGNALITTSTTFAIAFNVTYTDEGGSSRTTPLPLYTSAGALGNSMVNANGAIPYTGLPISLRAKAGTNIVFTTTGTFTAVVYNIEALLYQLK